MNLKLNWDGVGIATSILCAIHCALLPIIASSLPVLAGVHNIIFEWAMIILAFGVGIYSLRHGFKKHHRNYTPFYVFGLGFAFLIAKQFFHSQEIYFLVPAVVLMVAAHYRNYKLCKRSTCHSHHHEHDSIV